MEKLESSVDELKGNVGELKGLVRQLLRAKTPVASPLDRGASEKHGGLKEAQSRGEAAKVRWVQDGDLVPGQQLADSWGITRQALGAAAGRGETFSLKVGGRLYYPSKFLELERVTVSAVCIALGDITPTEKFVFWMRSHGSLGGRTVSDALHAGVAIERIVRLARAWAAERGSAGGAAKT
jgi:hypothetical protein